MRLLRPVESKWTISSPFGWRTIGGQEDHHDGIDFGVPENEPVVAVEDGEIFRAGWENKNHYGQGYGLRIIQRIKIDNKFYFTYYGHLNQLFIEEGEQIKIGETIALSGNTGRSTGPHLHFGIRENDTGKWINPRFYPDFTGTHCIKKT